MTLCFFDVFHPTHKYERNGRRTSKRKLSRIKKLLLLLLERMSLLLVGVSGMLILHGINAAGRPRYLATPMHKQTFLRL
jgi:hypothetical protein